MEKEMEIAALASGSSGNCFYVSNKGSGILIDAGISAKQIVTRLLKIGGNPEKIKAIFITHEHIDHVRGADVLARKLNIPVYATKKTAENCNLCSDKNLIRHIKNTTVTSIGKMKIEAFSKWHSAADPISYNVYGKKKVSVITDLGKACENVKRHISDCHFLFIESNHDEKMLENGPYPAFLKKWIKSNDGHLSNKDAAICIAENVSKNMEKIVLSHLSKTNNTPLVALKTFKEITSNKISQSNIIISYKEEPTKLFRI